MIALLITPRHIYMCMIPSALVINPSQPPSQLQLPTGPRAQLHDLAATDASVRMLACRCFSRASRVAHSLNGSAAAASGHIPRYRAKTRRNRSGRHRPAPQERPQPTQPRTTHTDNTTPCRRPSSPPCRWLGGPVTCLSNEAFAAARNRVASMGFYICT